ITAIAAAIVSARKANKAVIFSLGGHVVKTGISPILIDLIQRGLISALAVNGALAIHDCEIGLFGATSEDVVAGLRDGTFGMSRETAAFYNDNISAGVDRGMGIGESLGRALLEANAQYGEYSLLATACNLSIPCTVHVALGTDIVHCHPNADGRALGEGS